MSHVFARCASKKHKDMRDLHAFSVQFSHFRVFSDSRNACNSSMSDSRNVQKRATKSDTSGQGLANTVECVAKKGRWNLGVRAAAAPGQPGQFLRLT